MAIREEEGHRAEDAGGVDSSVPVAPDVEANDLEEAGAFARLGVWAVPVAIVHLFLLYAIVRAATGFNLPAFLHADALIAWLWVNGAALALAVWLWRKGRVPAAPGKWVKGARAKRLILAWLGLSLGWFLLPSLIHGATQVTVFGQW